MRHRKVQVTISSDEFFEAGANWINFWKPHSVSPYVSYYEFLGIHTSPYSKVKYTEKYSMDVDYEIARKVRLLNSPHHHAFLMAYKARKEAK